MRLTNIILVISCISLTFAPRDQLGQQAPKNGYLRFWDMVPLSNGSFELRKANAPRSEGTMLAATAYHYSGYAEYPAGKYRLGVFRAGDDRPIKIMDIDLK